jgi:hypothetical protein
MAANAKKIMSGNLTVAYGSENLPLRIGTLELPCFILKNKQVVFSKAGLQKALGYEGRSEDWLFDLLSSINKFYPIPGDLFDAYENPVRFEIRHADESVTVVAGLSPEAVISTCQTIINAKNDGYLNVSQLKHAKAAAIIVRYFDQNNIEASVAQATGLNFARETGKEYMQQYLLQNIDDAMYQWVIAFRDAFWEKIFDLHDMDWTDLYKNPKDIAHILQEVVFSRLPEHLAQILRTSKPKRTYKRKDSKAQDNEHPELRAYLSELLSLLKAAADNWTIFLQLLGRIYPKNDPDDIRFAEIAPTKDAAENSLLDKHLKTGIAVNRLYKKAK